MYAIVRSGGRQHKVTVGDVVEVNRLPAEPGANVALPAVLVVSDGEVTADADGLSSVAVTAEVVEHTKGPKIRMHMFRNKTGYHRRLGHRQPLTKLRVTGIEKK